MRKFYLLLTLVAGLIFQGAEAQDTANFNFTIVSNNLVYFANTSHLHGDAMRKAYWSFGDGTRQMTTPLANTSHQYGVTGITVITACLRIYKYLTSSNDSILTGETCRTFTLQPNTVPADSCSANFTDTLPSPTSITKLFVALPWHNHGKKPEQICWHFGDGTDTCINYNPSLFNNYSVSHHYATTGAYTVCVTIKYQGGCQSTNCREIHVATGDICRADYTMDPVTTSPLSRKFNAIPWHIQQKKPLRVCWQFGDGADTCIFYSASFSGPYSIIHNYIHTGQYNVCVKILYDGGCESTKCIPITITTPVPVPDSCYVNLFEASTNANNIVRHLYVGIMPNRIPEKICWYFGDGTDTCINLPNPVSTQSLTIEHHYPAPGVYHVCVKLRYAGGCEAQKCRDITIMASTDLCGGYMTDSVTGPKAYIFKGFSVMNSSDHVISWYWAFGDGTGSNQQQASHTYLNGGNFEVCLTITTDLGCVTKICKHILVQGSNYTQLILSPNPVSTNLHAVFLSTLQEQVTISIYNANGVVVRTYVRTAAIGTNTWDFDVASLPAGIYSVIVSSPHQLANAIFFKQ